MAKVSIARVLRPLLPMMAMQFAVLLLITYVPDLSLALPRLLLGYGG